MNTEREAAARRHQRARWDGVQNERQNELISVSFAQEEDYLRSTAYAFDEGGGAGLELTDVPVTLSARLRPWLLDELRERCSLHLLDRATERRPRGGTHTTPASVLSGSASPLAPVAERSVGSAAAMPARRIQIICPCGNAERFRAANEVVVRLLSEERVRHWGGLTYSSIADPAFTGAFWDQQAQEWAFDRHVLILIDAVDAGGDGCEAYAAGLHDLVHQIYERHGQPQQRLWVTTQPLSVVGIRQ